MKVKKLPTRLQQKVLDAILEILQEFDWTRTQQVMEMLKWRWAGYDDTLTEQDLKSFAVNLILDTLDKYNLENSEGNFSSRCGGFQVDVNMNVGLSIELSFVLTSWYYDELEGED